MVSLLLAIITTNQALIQALINHLHCQVCSPAAEALEGIRYPRVAAVTVRGPRGPGPDPGPGPRVMRVMLGMVADLR